MVEEIEDDDEDEQTSRRAHQALLSLTGFIISVIFILWGWVSLLRFWIFESDLMQQNIFYNVMMRFFILTILVIGIIFNITSVNLLLFDGAVSCHGENAFHRCLVIRHNLSVFQTRLSSFREAST